jgi:hypothetical protein
MSDSHKNPPRHVDEKTENGKNTPASPEDPWRSQSRYDGLKLVPWNEIWASIAAAKLRGNTEMLKAFYETLYREALFDDHGAWSLITRPRE